MTALPPAPSLRVYLAAVADHGAAQLRQLERAVLLPEEQKRARGMMDAGTRDAFVLAHALQRLVLRDVLGHAPRFETGSRGKPLLIGDPVHVNISHCVGHAACALSTGGPVGVDIESLPPRVDIRRVMASALTREECDRVRAESNPELSFLVHWTAKEAYVKATGEGLGRGLATLSLAFGDWPLRIAGERVEPHSLQCRTLRDRVLAVCTLGPAAPQLGLEQAVCDIRGVLTRVLPSR